MKKKTIFLGEKHEVNADLKENLQKSLDNTLPGCFIVDYVTITPAVIEIKIIRTLKNFYEPSKSDTMILDDAALLGGHIHGGVTRIPLPMHPFADYFKYSFRIVDILDGYNRLKGITKIKKLDVLTAQSYVIYRYVWK